MKILFVAPWIPSPVRPRSLAFLRMLAADHDVHFLALVRNAAEKHLSQALPVTQRTVVPNRRVGSMLRSLRALGTGASLQEGYASPKSLRAAFARKLAEWQPDVVHLNVFRTAHLVEACGRVPVVVDLDEFRSEYYEQLASHGPSAAWRVLGRIEAPRMRAREDELVRMGVPLMLSAPPLPGQERPNTYVVRSLCDLPVQHRDGRHHEDQHREDQHRDGRHREDQHRDDRHRDDRHRDGQRGDGRAEPVVLFVGRLSYEANVSGIMWFVRECWADVRRAVPDARLRIVGSDPPRAIRSLAGNGTGTGSGIEIYPNAPETASHYAAASVAIAPVFRCSGIQMKLIQALCAGVPTVTTGMVAARAGTRDGVHVRVADDRAGWTAAVRGLLDREAGTARLAAGGREWAVAHHGPAAVRRQLDAAYAALATGAQVRRLAGGDSRDIH